MFLGGFMSDMTGNKALALEAFCRAEGLPFTRFDYRGHGQSSGAFRDGTIGLWAADALAVLDEVAAGPQVLVGSSMGGWIMLLAALARPARIAGLCGIAAAPDFTTRIEQALDDGQRADLDRQGWFGRPTPYADEAYAITRGLLEDGRRHLLLDRPLPVGVPVRLLHGMADDSVPWQLSLTLAERLESPDVRIVLVKDGDHRLSTESDLALLRATVGELVSIAA